MIISIKKFCFVRFSTIFSNVKEKVITMKKKSSIIFSLIFITFFIVWLYLFTKYFGFALYKKHYPMPITMFFGGFIAGFTSEGGGAVAFPVFTKLLKVSPHIARDFSFCIQSVGMTFASIVIVLRKIQVDLNVIKYATFGGVIGIIFGSLCLDPYIAPAVVRIIFSIVLASFGIMIYMKNFKLKIIEIEKLSRLRKNEIIYLLMVGFAGGIFSSLIGTGGDFITFGFVVLYFKLNEKIATPTSVIIMALESIFGSLFRLLVVHDLSSEAVTYFSLCAPIVALMAPLGSVLCSKVSRLFIVKFLLFLITVEFITTLIIFKFKLMLVIPTIIMFGIQLILYRRFFKEKTTYPI